LQKFAFIVHPIDVRRDTAKKIPIARYLPERMIERMLLKKDPVIAANVTGIRAASGEEAEGWFIGCPLSPRQLVSLPVDFVYDKLEQCGRIAEDLGAKIIGLGAFTSVAGDGGITLEKRLNIAVTTGNSYTVATAVEGAEAGAARMGIDLETATVAVVGATGSIGATCAEMLGRKAREVVLIGRDSTKLQALAERLKDKVRARLSVHTSVEEGLRNADVVVTVSSAAQAIVLPKHIKRGAVVCDVARPRDVSVAVAKERNDVLVIEGGVVQVPGSMLCTQPDGTPFNFGFPPGTAYACMSETIALALAGRYENFTLGKEVSVAQADEISKICSEQGFRLAGWRSFERAVTEQEIDRIRERAGRAPLPSLKQGTGPSAAPSRTLP
jgi:predicted amino acid dehydrogenase